MLMNNNIDILDILDILDIQNKNSNKYGNISRDAVHGISADIRDKESLTENEVRQLNFISDSPAHHFRKHYRQGLRSHIFEVLAADDVLKERQGDIIDGIRCFPRAVPEYMLRILRTRFSTLDQAIDEVRKYTLILKFLGTDLIACSQESIVEYIRVERTGTERIESTEAESKEIENIEAESAEAENTETENTETEKSEIVLCGLQEYVVGTILDPWSLLTQAPLDAFYQAKFPDDHSVNERMTKAFDSIEAFVKQTREMIINTGYIPDLAGNGNLILIPEGGIKLVDINNIIKVHHTDTIYLDDKNYPSCDKSVEVLAILEQKILKTGIIPDDPLYGHFLSVERKNRVKKFEEKFFQSLRPSPAG